MKHYNVGPVSMRVWPYWTGEYMGADQFGPPILRPVDSLLMTDLICGAVEAGLVEAASAHDDDLVNWNPDEPEDDLKENGPVAERILTIRQKLDAGDAGFHMITCCLHGHPMFRRGGLTNPDPKIRAFAKSKVMRALRIGHKLGAKVGTYWVARDGFDTLPAIPLQAYEWLGEGLNTMTDYNEVAKLGYTMFTIEPKPNEPPGRTFLPTAGHAVGFIHSMLAKPNMWKVNPELPQHEGMTLLDPVSCALYLVSLAKLGFLHVGNQINGQFDNDSPPLVGPEHLREMVYMFYVLQKLGWKGVVEFDCHPLRRELNPEDPIGCKKQFIRNCSNGLAIALALAKRIEKFDPAGMGESEADLANIMQMTNLDPAEVARIAIRDGQPDLGI